MVFLRDTLMRLVIIKEDNAVIMDGERHTVDCSDLPADFHALQWAGEGGEVEYSMARCGHCGARSKKPNEYAHDFALWQPYVDRWRAAKAAHEAELARQTAEATNAARPEG
jgi:hypothetical protein